MRCESLWRSPGVLIAVDSCWTMFVLFPILCSYWRGSWSLLSYYVVPCCSNPASYLLMMAVGSLYLITFCILPLVKKALDDAPLWKYVICTRLILVYQGLLYMFLWRGTWGALEHYVGDAVVDSVICLFLSLAFLVLMGCTRSAFWPPYYIELDSRPTFLEAVLCFDTPPDQPLRYVGDCTVTALIILTTPMLAWRSAFHIMDMKVYPQDPLKADIVCFLFGFCGSALLFCTQTLLGRVSIWFEQQGRQVQKILYEDVIYVIAFFFLAPLWRGLWNLNIRFLITDDCVGGWVHHIIGMFGLLLTQTYSYVGVWCCIKDGKDPGGGAFFPHHYYRKVRDRTFSLRQLHNVLQTTTDEYPAADIRRSPGTEYLIDEEDNAGHYGTIQ